jgi:hypothetical protein
MKKLIYYLKLIVKGLEDISLYDSGICPKDKDPFDYIAKRK